MSCTCPLIFIQRSNNITTDKELLLSRPRYPISQYKRPPWPTKSPALCSLATLEISRMEAESRTTLRRGRKCFVRRAMFCAMDCLSSCHLTIRTAATLVQQRNSWLSVWR